MQISCRRRSIPTVDRISYLPESILCHILSFLPTKQAAATTILSKRWKSLWLSLFTLHFDDQTFKNFQTFHNFIHLIMFSLRDKNIPIHSFTLKCTNSPCFTQSQFNTILKFVMQRIQNLNIDMKKKNNNKYYLVNKLPPIILSFKTLVVLKLANIKIGKFDQVNYPCVKTLHLDSDMFISPLHIKKFLFGCPILQDLRTKSLSLETSYHNRLTLNPLPNLVKVRMCDDHNDFLIKFVSKAQIMHVEKFKRWSRNFLQRFHVFHNLTYLELSFHTEIWDASFQLLEILSYFPMLQHFNIQHMHIESGCWKRPDAVPECLSSQLKTCCIRGFDGSTRELEFAKYIIKHSKVLKTMKIRSPFLFFGMGLKDSTKMKLSSCKKGSSTCKIVFD